jgi:hypothetical protein
MTECVGTIGYEFIGLEVILLGEFELVELFIAVGSVVVGFEVVLLQDNTLIEVHDGFTEEVLLLHGESTVVIEIALPRIQLNRSAEVLYRIVVVTLLVIGYASLL